MIEFHRVKPLVAPVIRRVFGTLQRDTEVLQPEEIEEVRPLALLPGMLDRVTDTDEHSRLADHISVAQATVLHHAPVLRHHYYNAVVHRNGFSTWSHNEKYGRGYNWADLSSPITYVPELRYCHNYVIWRYFGHWLTDAIPSALIDPEKGALWMPPHPSWTAWGHTKDYLDALGLSVLNSTLVHADHLITYQDFGQGSHKKLRYKEIRDRLQMQFGGGEESDFVYISRGNTGSQRIILNEAELLDLLTARGWTIFDISTATVEELQRTLCRARVVVSIDGSHIDHAHLSLLSGSAMVVLMPNDRFNTRQFGVCNAHGVSMGMAVLIGDSISGYYANLDEILRTIDLARF